MKSGITIHGYCGFKSENKNRSSGLYFFIKTIFISLKRNFNAGASIVI
jgi:hypothetical protein